MPEVQLNDIVRAIEEAAPLSLQESWDNSGLQIAPPQPGLRFVKGVLTAVDVTPEVIEEAIESGANLVVSHHPLLFRGLKSITGDTRTERSVIMAIKNDIAVYSAHTSLDNADNGVSHLMAHRLGLDVVRPLVPSSPGAATGTGVVCRPHQVKPLADFIELLREVFPHGRTSELRDLEIPVEYIAICGGSGAPFIGDAIRNNCQLFITGDLKHHDFVDFADDIALADCGHYETEELAKVYLAQIIRSKFNDLAVHISSKDKSLVNHFNP